MAIPQLDLELDKDGHIFDAAALALVVQAAPRFSDIIVACHGWNNDKADASNLYDRLFQKLDEVLSGGFVAAAAGRTFGAVRLFWPSKRFTDEDLIPGGGAASATAANDRTLETLIDGLKNDPARLGEPFEDPIRSATLDRAKALVPRLENDEAARREFVLHLRAILNPREAHPEDGSLEFFAGEPEVIFQAMNASVSAPVAAAGAGGAADVHGGNVGGAAGLRDLLGGARAAARRLLNFTTYYEMKERAGTVGRIGGSQLLREIRKAASTARIHLVGHSFGARLVTAAANELDPQTPSVTMTLLQAAFSHNGLSSRFDGTNDGAFRRIVTDKRISGPILITHTKNDRAVGIAYPLASRIASQKAAALGDENDPYGGLGRNGAQHTPEATPGELLGVAKPYAFKPGGVFNLKADRIITEHSDIAHHEVAYALLVSATSVP